MTLYTFDYSSTDYDPPAPVVEIRISNVRQQTPEVTLSALVDSGADATMLPITALQSVGARYVETRQMRGIIGVAYPVDLYLVTVHIGSHTVPVVRVVASATENEAILGRDVLNHLIVTLNGLASVTEVSS